MCTKCGATKPLTEFYKKSASRDGLTAQCKACIDVKNSEWQKSNRDKRKVIAARWVANHYEQHTQAVAKWQAENSERVAQTSAAWAKQNPEKRRASNTKARKKNPAKAAARAAKRRKEFPAEHCADENKRRAHKLQATPVWANEFFIGEIYALSALRTKTTGIKWHVDHIVPLRSKKVCGLHVEFNLRVIPAVVNEHKGNRHWPDMPKEIHV